MLLFNHSDLDFEVNQGDRVAQLILEKVEMSEVEEVEVSRRPVVSLFWACTVGAKEGGRGWSFGAASVGRRDGRGRRGVRGKERARADPFPFLLFFFSRWTTPFEELVDSDPREGSLPSRSPRLSSFVQMSSCRTTKRKEEGKERP